MLFKCCNIQHREIRRSLWERNQFITSAYRKPTVSGVFSHFDCFIPRCYKFILVSTFILRYYSVCFGMELFHNEIIYLKEIFGKKMDMIISFLISVSEPLL